MNFDKYVPILCKTDSQRSELAKILHAANIPTSRVKNTEDRLLAYFSEESHLEFIKKLLKERELINEEPYLLSPKQISMLR